MINKTVANVDEAITGVKSNMVLMFGGFGLCGIAENCINALSKKILKALRAFQITLVLMILGWDFF